MEQPNTRNYDRLKEKTLTQTYHFKGKVINLRVDDVELSDGSTSSERSSSIPAVYV